MSIDKGDNPWTHSEGIKNNIEHGETEPIIDDKDVKQLPYGFGKFSPDLCQECFASLFFSNKLKTPAATRINLMMKFREKLSFNPDWAILWAVSLFDYYTNYTYVNKRLTNKQLSNKARMSWGDLI